MHGGCDATQARWLACRARSTSPRPDGRWRNATTPFELQFALIQRRTAVADSYSPQEDCGMGIWFPHQDDLVQRVTMLVMRAPEHRRRRTR
jgi:hypothetical protein